MIIEKNGIKLNITQERKRLLVQVESQTQEASELLRRYGQIQDMDSGIIIRSNKYPSFNKKLKKLFVWGSQADKNNTIVEIPTKNEEDNTKIIQGINEALELLVPVEYGNPAQLRFAPGSTVAVRMKFINRKLATKLGLTNKKDYPVECIEWEKCKPISIFGNQHYSVHIASAVDILNKSIGEKKHLNNQFNVNPHFVSPQQAKDAVKILKDAFNTSEEKGCEVAFWRLVTALRSYDISDKMALKLKLNLENEQQ